MEVGRGGDTTNRRRRRRRRNGRAGQLRPAINCVRFLWVPVEGSPVIRPRKGRVEKTNGERNTENNKKQQRRRRRWRLAATQKGKADTNVDRNRRNSIVIDFEICGATRLLLNAPCTCSDAVSFLLFFFCLRLRSNASETFSSLVVFFVFVSVPSQHLWRESCMRWSPCSTRRNVFFFLLWVLPIGNKSFSDFRVLLWRLKMYPQFFIFQKMNRTVSTRTWQHFKWSKINHGILDFTWINFKNDIAKSTWSVWLLSNVAHMMTCACFQTLERNIFWILLSRLPTPVYGDIF